MRRVWVIVKREFMYNLRRPSFLFAAFGTPFIVVGLWVLIFAVIDIQSDTGTEDLTFGYVDNAGVIVDESPTTLPVDEEAPEDSRLFTFNAFADAESARAALDAEEIEAYFLISQSYLQDGSVERYGVEDVPDSANDVFRRFLIANLRQEIDTELVSGLSARLNQPVDEMDVFLLDSGRELQEDSLPILLLLPIFFAVIFFMSVQTTSTFLMNGLVEEKKNRIVEIIITTITPMQLLLGKIIGLGLLGMLQVSIWAGVVLAAFLLGPQLEFLSILEGTEIPIDIIALAVVYFVLGYFSIAGMLAVVGVLAGTEQQGNQYGAFFTLPGYLIPLLVLTTFITDSNGTLPTVLSLIPITAPVSMIIRVGYAAVPVWQIALSMGLLLLTTLLAAWISARLFRWGLLMYGKQFSVRDLIRVITSNQQPEVTGALVTPAKEA
ncbi:MAG: ABC transporter permease [Chloroflexota bacterium]